MLNIINNTDQMTKPSQTLTTVGGNQCRWFGEDIKMFLQHASKEIYPSPRELYFKESL